MSLEKIVANLVQKVDYRFYGKYRGIVVDNADPEQLGRLKLQVPSVLGEEVVTGWAMPCVPYGGNANQGFLFIPEVGAGVWVEFEEGDLEFPIWVGTFWSKPGGKSELPKSNDTKGNERDKIQNPPTRKIIKTKKGHTIQFEDAEGQESIIISDGKGENRIVLNDDGITITNKSSVIALTEQGILVQDVHSNSITCGTEGILIKDTNGNEIVMDALSGITMNGENNVCLEGLIGWLIGHTHIGNMGAPCPLNPVDSMKLQQPILDKNNILSKKVKLG